MGLLSTLTDNNKIIHQGKAVSYSVRPIFGSWCYGSGPTISWRTKVWEYHRYCTYSYSYVGLDKATATGQVDGKITKYTRQMYYSEWNTDSGVFDEKNGGTCCMAEVSARPTQGDMWQLDVTIREDTVRLNISNLQASSVFGKESSWEYD